MPDQQPSTEVQPTQEKVLLRARMRRVREGIGAERGALADSAAERLLGLPEIHQASVLMLYLSHRFEISTDAALDGLAGSGRTLLLPSVDGDLIRPSMFRLGEALVEGALGPREPATLRAFDPDDIEVVVVPGLAFDRSGHRLGQGGGHYDRFLTTLPSGCIRVGLCFQAQLLDRVPHGPADEPVHVVVTDAEVVRPRSSP